MLAATYLIVRRATGVDGEMVFPGQREAEEVALGGEVVVVAVLVVIDPRIVKLQMAQAVFVLMVMLVITAATARRRVIVILQILLGCPGREPGQCTR